MSATETATGAETSRAWRLEQKIARGLPIPDASRAWLSRYRRDHPAPARRRSSPSHAEPVSAPANDNAPPAEQQAPQSSPEPLAPAAGGGVPPPSTPAPPPLVVDLAPAPVGAELDQVAHEQAQVAAHADSLAGMYCDWLKAANGEIAQLGGLALPAELIDGVVRPAAAALIVRTMPREVLSEKAQAVVVLGAGGVTVAQRHVLRKRAGITPAASADQPAAHPPATAPAAATAPRPPANAVAEPVEGSWHRRLA